MLADDTVRAALRTSWHLRPDGCSRLAGGLNSVTWSVICGDQTYIAKSVPYAQRRQFEAGLAAAEHLQRHGIDAGLPVRSADGQLIARVGGDALAVLSFVPGRPLDGADPVDQQWWGDRLGAAHRLLAKFTHPGVPGWHWVRPDAPHLRLESWLAPAIGRAVRDLDRLQVRDRLTFGVLHGDPYHGAFLLDAGTGRVGIIDWGSVNAGPLVYDIASAVMYAGGPDRAADLIASYAAAGAVSEPEVAAALPTLLRFRWAVQADYFAARVMRDPSPGNVAGLRDARDALLG